MLKTLREEVCDASLELDHREHGPGAWSGQKKE